MPPKKGTRRRKRNEEEDTYYVKEERYSLKRSTKRTVGSEITGGVGKYLLLNIDQLKESRGKAATSMYELYAARKELAEMPEWEGVGKDAAAGAEDAQEDLGAEQLQDVLKGELESIDEVVGTSERLVAVSAGAEQMLEELGKQGQHRLSNTRVRSIGIDDEFDVDTLQKSLNTMNSEIYKEITNTKKTMALMRGGGGGDESRQQPPKIATAQHATDVLDMPPPAPQTPRATRRRLSPRTLRELKGLEVAVMSGDYSRVQNRYRSDILGSAKALQTESERGEIEGAFELSSRHLDELRQRHGRRTVGMPHDANEGRIEDEHERLALLREDLKYNDRMYYAAKVKLDTATDYGILNSSELDRNDAASFSRSFLTQQHVDTVATGSSKIFPADNLKYTFEALGDEKRAQAFNFDSMLALGDNNVTKGVVKGAKGTALQGVLNVEGLEAERMGKSIGKLFSHDQLTTEHRDPHATKKHVQKFTELASRAASRGEKKTQYYETAGETGGLELGQEIVVGLDAVHKYMQKIDKRDDLRERMMNEMISSVLNNNKLNGSRDDSLSVGQLNSLGKFVKGMLRDTGSVAGGLATDKRLISKIDNLERDLQQLKSNSSDIVRYFKSSGGGSGGGFYSQPLNQQVKEYKAAVAKTQEINATPITQEAQGVNAIISTSDGSAAGNPDVEMLGTADDGNVAAKKTTVMRLAGITQTQQTKAALGYHARKVAMANNDKDKTGGLTVSAPLPQYNDTTDMEIDTGRSKRKAQPQHISLGSIVPAFNKIASYLTGPHQVAAGEIATTLQEQSNRLMKQEKEQKKREKLLSSKEEYLKKYAEKYKISPAEEIKLKEKARVELEELKKGREDVEMNLEFDDQARETEVREQQTREKEERAEEARVTERGEYLYYLREIEEYKQLNYKNKTLLANLALAKRNVGALLRNQEFLDERGIMAGKERRERYELKEEDAKGETDIRDFTGEELDNMFGEREGIARSGSLLRQMEHGLASLQKDEKALVDLDTVYSAFVKGVHQYRNHHLDDLSKEERELAKKESDLFLSRAAEVATSLMTRLYDPSAIEGTYNEEGSRFYELKNTQIGPLMKDNFRILAHYHYQKWKSKYGKNAEEKEIEGYEDSALNGDQELEDEMLEANEQQRQRLREDADREAEEMLGRLMGIGGERSVRTYTSMKNSLGAVHANNHIAQLKNGYIDEDEHIQRSVAYQQRDALRDPFGFNRAYLERPATDAEMKHEERKTEQMEEKSTKETQREHQIVAHQTQLSGAGTFYSRRPGSVNTRSTVGATGYTNPLKGSIYSVGSEHSNVGIMNRATQQRQSELHQQKRSDYSRQQAKTEQQLGEVYAKLFNTYKSKEEFSSALRERYILVPREGEKLLQAYLKHIPGLSGKSETTNVSLGYIAERLREDLLVGENYLELYRRLGTHTTQETAARMMNVAAVSEFLLKNPQRLNSEAYTEQQHRLLTTLHEKGTAMLENAMRHNDDIFDTEMNALTYNKDMLQKILNEPAIEEQEEISATKMLSMANALGYDTKTFKTKATTLAEKDASDAQKAMNLLNEREEILKRGAELFNTQGAQYRLSQMTVGGRSGFSGGKGGLSATFAQKAPYGAGFTDQRTPAFRTQQLRGAMIKNALAKRIGSRFRQRYNVQRNMETYKGRMKNGTSIIERLKRPQIISKKRRK